MSLKTSNPADGSKFHETPLKKRPKRISRQKTEDSNFLVNIRTQVT